MRGQTPGSGFPIVQCPDLLDEILDLVEDEAFGEEEDLEPPIDEAEPMPTHREMVNVAYDEGSQIFAGLERPQGSKDPDIGPRQRPANIILTIFNIIRNLSVIPDNVPYLAKHERLLDILLRVCCVRRNDNVPRAMSMALSLTDLIIVRKDVLYTLAALAPAIQLPFHPSKQIARIVRRAFELIASYLIDQASHIL